MTILSNVSLEEPIEGGLAALLPVHDERITALCTAHAKFRSFLTKFTDEFGQTVFPSVLVVRSDAPPSIVSVEAMASFRVLISLSVIPYSRALELNNPRGHRILFSNTFWFYPWMIDKHFDNLIVSTPAALGIHKVAKFKGQSSPEIFPMKLAPSMIDAPLLRNLLECWRRRYTKPMAEWSDIALFRSLNMANQASLIPAASDITLYDVGRSIALWVSAFEILVHPGGNEQSNLKRVFDLLETVPWMMRRSSYRRFETGSKKARCRRTLVSWIYHQLYKARNDFLHGNPVSRDDLFFPVSKRNLFEYAGPLYRLALTAFLPLVLTRPIPSQENAIEFADYAGEHMRFRRYQQAFEECLLTVRQTAVAD